MWGCVPGGRACPHAMEEAQAEGQAGEGHRGRTLTPACTHACTQPQSCRDPRVPDGLLLTPAAAGDSGVWGPMGSVPLN